MNAGHDYRERLPSDADGVTLLDYLTRRYTHSTQEEWTRHIERGLVDLEGKAGSAADVLRPGQLLVWHRPPWMEPPAPTSYVVLHEDEDLLAVAKPPGLPTLPGAGYLHSTLLHLVQRSDPGAAPLHRLGRWTSGVVLFARGRDARADLSRQWAGRAVQKRYRALVSGDPAWDTRTVIARIGPVPHDRLGSVHAASPAGRSATSFVRVVERRKDGCLCDVEIATGRPHQVRIHLAAAGHPLAGDPLYAPGGVPRPGSTALPGDPGYLLHASFLAFRHPRTGLDLIIECPPPPELTAANRRLGESG